jgi:IrrE N-terminal-like domain
MNSRLSKEWLGLSEVKKSTIAAQQVSAPVKVGEIAKALGLSVKLATLAANVSGEIRPDPSAGSAGFLIRVDRHETKERQRFTVAHEIAHYLLHKDLIESGLSDDVLYRSNLSNRKEAEANRLAADLVMPWSLIDDWMEQFPSGTASQYAEQLALHLGVSKIALQVRLGE